MSRSSLPRGPRRFRRGVAVLALAAAPFTMAGACEEEPAEEPGIEEEEPLEEEED